MSNSTTTSIFDVAHTLHTNDLATAAALDIVAKACTAGDDTTKTAILHWVSSENNLINLRDKIIESAKD